MDKKANIKEKMAEVCDSLSLETGVSATNVNKILKRLNLQSALEHRIYATSIYTAIHELKKA